MIHNQTNISPLGKYEAVFFDNKTNITHVTVGWLWSSHPVEELDGSKASSSIAAILYGMRDITDLLQGKVNFSYVSIFILLCL